MMFNKKLLLAALLGTALIGGAFAGAKKEVTGLTIKPGVLMIGVAIEYPPLEYYGEDGVTPEGFDIEMGKALAAKLGLKAEFIDTAWDGIFAGLQTGKYDVIISGVTVTKERLEAFNFTKPYIDNTAMIFVVQKNSPIKFSKPEDLAGYRVTYQAESMPHFYANRIAEGGTKFQAFGYDNVMNCFDELKLGRCDIVITESLVGFEYLKRDPDVFRIAWQDDASGEKFGIVVKKGNDALTKEADKALDALFSDGTMKKISNDIFGLDFVSHARN